MPSTTIKVSPELRDRLNDEARRTRTTAAGVVASLLAEHDRNERFRAIREARSAMTPADRSEYDDETRVWDSPSLASAD
ncbi:MAG: hypothetical protein RI885_720 [Actinomycetota bacterium]|jgi:predicted transcriptional regulator